MDELYAMSLNVDSQEYLTVVAMIQEYLDMLSKYSTSVSYEYNLAKNLK